ncbi:hypothetical protein [Paenibacillus turpanensis]|uniref:hypothetical protein n=1 Tax=Paenibacillus turpanensis TaxID=2689078 RepID=UPI00140D667A|nr:hypothetical protein [Paenibacillus turpanensis]
MKNKKTMLMATFTLAAVLIAGQSVLAAESNAIESQPKEMETSGIMNPMDNPGMQKMMNAMNTPEGQEMMKSCSTFMDKYAQEE